MTLIALRRYISEDSLFNENAAADVGLYGLYAPSVLQRSEAPMLADLTPLQKLYNKGVDITAGVITSTISAGIIAAIGLLSWKVKLWLDGQRQLPEIRIAATRRRIATAGAAEDQRRDAHQGRGPRITPSRTDPPSRHNSQPGILFPPAASV